jgi:hypothetical protein
MAGALTAAQWNNVADILAIAPLCGLPAQNFAPLAFQAQAETSAQKNLPPGAPSDWINVCTASLLARGIIYYKNVPGDCGTPTQINTTNEQLAGVGGQIASGIASMAGSTLPGIGVFVSAIQDIFAAHAAAVANEQKTICAVAGVINQVFAYYDNLVRRGALSPSAAYTGMQTFLAQANAQLQTIEKKCNAACVYQGILAAHADFVVSYYPAIAPNQASAHAPGAPPASSGTTPGGVIQVGGAYETATSLSPLSSLSAPLVSVAGVSFSTGEILLALAALVTILAIAFLVIK